MAIPFETLKSYMPEIGLAKFDADDSKGRLLAGFSAKSGDSEYHDIEVGVVISRQEDGEFVQFRIFKLVEGEEVQASPYRDKLTTYFCKKNYENKIGRWCMDPNDGDIYVDWAIPVEDNDKLTLNQFKRVMAGLVSSTKESWAPIRRILKTGSEEKLDAAGLKKEIFFALVSSDKFDLMQKVAAISDITQLVKIKQLSDEKKFEEIETLL